MNFTKKEKDAYEYIEHQISTSKKSIENSYWEEVKFRLKTISKIKRFVSKGYEYPIRPEYIKFFNKLGEKDLKLFKRVKNIIYNKFKILYESKDSATIEKHRGFYWMWKYVVKKDYAIFGVNHLRLLGSIPEDIKVYSFTYMKYIKERIKFLNTFKSLSIAARTIKRKILEDSNNKVFIFTTRKEIADELSIYTFYTGNKNNEDNKSKFESGKIRELASINMLGSGMNFKGLNWAIFHSFTSSTAKEKQKMGRLNRLDIDDLGHVVFIIPKGTQSEVWFNDLDIDVDFKGNLNEFLKL